MHKSVIDGLTSTERKVMYVALKYNKLFRTKKFVSQVFEETEYHHSVHNIFSAIDKIIEKKFFDKFSVHNDDNLLYNFIEGKCYEPVFYVPLLPLILVERYSCDKLTDFMINKINQTSIQDEIFDHPIIALDDSNKLQTYKSLNVIIDLFYAKQLELYEKRISVIKLNLVRQILIYQNQIRFINTKLVNLKQRKSVLIDQLAEFEFDLIDNSFEYLLQMKISQMTHESCVNLQSVLNKTKNMLETYKTLTPADFYLRELYSTIKPPTIVY